MARRPERNHEAYNKPNNNNNNNNKFNRLNSGQMLPQLSIDQDVDNMELIPFKFLYSLDDKRRLCNWKRNTQN